MAERQLRNRVTLANKFVVKRLVFERLLYAEIWATENLRVQEVEQRIQSDIAATLNLFNHTVPNMISTVYALGGCTCLFSPFRCPHRVFSPSLVSSLSLSLFELLLFLSWCFSN